ncbi:Poly(A) polymerase catalytic subunit like [Actinidia chinensis var. chinensis]|uniref:Poly(A) polymerase catalytic subunit like n=1 Tax=Actinidia chinensis var. chinensis TaxID=1590841 RepID=A0A2R6Q6R5_ACTCC|nr:Poly(A) polymerase catalytic subunit like [Actinidia chinensis var. chinensis]
MEKKPGSFFFKRLGKKGSSKCWWRFRSSGFRWKKLSFRNWFVDGFLFKIVSLFEAVFLVGTLCFFYLCCGCHI